MKYIFIIFTFIIGLNILYQTGYENGRISGKSEMVEISRTFSYQVENSCYSELSPSLKIKITRDPTNENGDIEFVGGIIKLENKIKNNKVDSYDQSD